MAFPKILFTISILVHTIVLSESSQECDNDFTKFLQFIERNKTELVSKLLHLQNELPEDAKLNFKQLAEKYGFHSEEHQVTTDDGYILTLFHIPGKGLPYLLVHGFLDSSDTFVIRGDISLAITLAKAGNDVWIANLRGTRYSLGHKSLNADDKEYWNFSLHEFGYYDYPALIDYVLDQTGQEKLTVIGHSQGSTAFFILGSLRPEYNDKINVLIALAPVAYLHHMKSHLRFAAKLEPILKQAFDGLNIFEILRDGSVLRNLIQLLCSQDVGSYEFCVEGALFALVGPDSEQLEREFSKVVFGHYPSSVSMKTLYHYAQIANRKKFAEYDYGEHQNVDIYGSKTAPEYNLKSVTAKVVLLVGSKDYLATIENVALLKEQLPNVIEYREFSNFNHVDFVWGKYMPKLLYPHVFDALKKCP